MGRVGRSVREYATLCLQLVWFGKDGLKREGVSFGGEAVLCKTCVVCRVYDESVLNWKL